MEDGFGIKKIGDVILCDLKVRKYKVECEYLIQTILGKVFQNNFLSEIKTMYHQIESNSGHQDASFEPW